jgi:hypothetical protein
MKQIINRIIDKMASVIARRAVLEFRQTIFWDAKTINAAIESQREIDRLRSLVAEKTPSCPLLYGYSVYSQCDEDGIIAHILKVIGKQLQLAKTCIEFGAGNGRENNTHYLLLQGYKGFWVDGSPDNLEFLRSALGGLEFDNLVARCVRIDLENLKSIFDDARKHLGSDIDLFSVDLDGNDIYVLQESLKLIQPKVVVAEYNAKFRPPANIAIRYDASHVWREDDFFGASLTALGDALRGYQLVSCNLTGANAFFVRNDLAALFPHYSLEDLYQPLRQHLVLAKAAGFEPSMKYLKQSIKNLNAAG